MNSNTVVASKLAPGFEVSAVPDAERKAMDNRPELKAQKAEMDISSTSVDLAKSSYHPAVTGSVHGGLGAMKYSEYKLDNPGVSLTALVI